MKKIIIASLAVVLSLTVLTVNDASAVNFSGKESYYIKLCSSSSLSSSQMTTCKSFNTYLKEKNQDLKEDISDTKKDLSTTKNSLSDAKADVDAISKKISQKESEINYLLSSIKRFQKQISTKEENMRQRLYSMQSYYNSNSYVSFLFGSDSFSDFFSRMNSLNDITSYEEELMKELRDDQKELEKQKETLTTAKANLQEQKNEAVALQDHYISLAASQQSELNSQTSEQKEISAAQAKIDAQLQALMSAAPSGSTSGYVVTGNSALGNAIAKAAQTRLGCRYWWAKAGPTYFDCSGLVYWCMQQAGVPGSRTNAATLSKRGVGISYSQLQAGDIITFSDGSGVEHVGIYIGGGKMIHAAGMGSGTRGQYPDQCVKVANITPGSYWSKYVHNYRRLY